MPAVWTPPETQARTAAATVSSPTTFPSTSAVDNDCFLGADGGEYCVVEPATTTASWDSLEPTQSALAGVSLGVDGKDTPGEGIGGGNEALSLYTMMGLCFLVAIVCALDRVAMSVAIVPMGEVYGYSDTTKGLVSGVLRISLKDINHIRRANVHDAPPYTFRPCLTQHFV